MGIFSKKAPPLPAADRPKAFRLELGWRGIFGLVVVCLCLFLWMFLLGIWAGQTILLPTNDNRLTRTDRPAKPLPTRTAEPPSSTKESP